MPHILGAGTSSVTCLSRRKNGTKCRRTVGHPRPRLRALLARLPLPHSPLVLLQRVAPVVLAASGPPLESPLGVVQVQAPGQLGEAMSKRSCC